MKNKLIPYLFMGCVVLMAGCEEENQPLEEGHAGPSIDVAHHFENMPTVQSVHTD